MNGLTAIRVAYRDRLAALALAGDSVCGGIVTIATRTADVRQRIDLGMALTPTGVS